MARKARTKSKAKPRAKRTGVEEKQLTKGQLRKLNALRKSVGDKIGEKAFADWLKTQGSEAAPQVDKNAETIVTTLNQLVNAGKLRVPRGGYLLTRGRGRVIVSRAREAG